jgi:RHS repeat-associated protein
VARQLYHPYGSPRWSQGTLPTDYTFTGQRNEAGLGLMHYGARFYSPRLGRFVSADTIVPDPTNPQELNRYAYCLNNSLRYVDPTGQQVEAGVLTAISGPPGWVIAATGIALVVSYQYGWGPNAAQNRAAIENAVAWGRGLLAGTTATSQARGLTGGQVAFPGPPQLNPDPDKDPFKGASEEIQRGVRTLRAQANSAKNWLRSRLGAQAHLRSAEYYHSQGILESVNPTGAGSVDLTLQGNIGVEVKYWSYETLEGSLDTLSGQLIENYSTFDQTILQFYQTTYETPVTAEMIPQIYEWLAARGVDTANLVIQVVEHSLVVP